MKTILLLAVFAGATLSSSAQTCNHYVYPAAGSNYHITTDTTINDQSGSNYYICSGLNVTVQASAGSNYLLEDNVTLTINSQDGDNVNAKGNCTIVDNTTESITVNMESTSTFSKPNMPGAAVVNTCSPMVFDYSFVGGSSPCPTSTDIDDDSPDLLSLYPNPLNGNKTIKIPATIEKLVVYDMTGRIIYSSRISSTEVDLSLLNSGCFIVHATNQQGSLLTTRLIVN